MKIPKWLSDTAETIRRFFRRLWNGRHVIGDLIKHKHRFIVLDTETYKEKVSFQLSGLHLFVFLGITAIVLVLLTSILLAFTPLRELIPGYTNDGFVEQTYRNARLADSLAHQLKAQEDMLFDIQDIMLGKDPGTRHSISDTTADSNVLKQTIYSRSDEDSLLRSDIEARGGDVSFVLPLAGKVKRKYNASSGFTAIEVAGSAGSDIKAVQQGIVLWSFKDDDGLVTVMIEHPYAIFSLYRCEGKPLKEAGAEVEAGEPVAKISPRKSTDEAILHFEMRKQGEPVNPSNYLKY